MKTRSLFISMLLLIVLMAACNGGSSLTRATGFAYEVVVVMDQKDWKAPAGEAIKAELTSSIPGLPQSEPAMKVTYSKPTDFNGLLKYVRNILIVTIDPTASTKVSMAYEENPWANGQVVLKLKAPSEESLLEYLMTDDRSLVNFFTKVEMNRAINQLQKDYSSVVMDNLKQDLDVMLNAPANFTYYRDTTDFFWSSNNANTGRMDLVVYTFPYTDTETFTKEYLVAKRDSVLAKNLPGSFPGSYMQTEARFDVDYTPITLNGKYCGVMRGLWRMQGDMMGGPFVSHTRLDEKNNRVVVAEGFVYAPETDKRNFMRRIEAALYTLRLPGEFDQSMDEKLNIPEEK